MLVCTAACSPSMPTLISSRLERENTMREPKTPACPVVVNPVPRDAEGEWTVKEDGNNVIAEFRGPKGNLIGFALTGEGTKEKMRLQKELPPVMA